LLEIRDHVFKDRTVTSKLMKEIDKESKKLKEPSTSSSGSSRHSRRSETDPAGAGLHPDGDRRRVYLQVIGILDFLQVVFSAQVNLQK